MKKNTSGRKPQKLNSPYEAARLLRLQHMFTVMTVIAVLMAERLGIDLTQPKVAALDDIMEPAYSD